MIVCDDCKHKEMCKWKIKMYEFVSAMIDNRPNQTAEEIEFEKDYFAVEFGCKKFLSEFSVSDFPFANLREQ